MDRQEGDNNDDIVELAQQDDVKDSVPEMQQDEIEKSTQETEEDEHKDSRPTILQVLTPKCFRSIFTYLTINDVVRSERVCRAWQEQVLQYLPSVHNYRIALANRPCRAPERNISFRTITLSKAEINKMIRKMGKYFVRLYSDCINEEDSRALSEHCTRLEYLLLNGTRVHILFDDDDDSTDEENVPDRMITGVFVTDLRVDLTTLGLSFLRTLRIEYLLSAAQRLAILTRLDLNFNTVETLRGVSSLLESMPLLEHLSLMEYQRRGEPDVDPPRFDRLSRLRELHLWGNELVTDSWVEAAASCETLRVLNVGTCFEVSVEAIVALCRKRGELIELVLSRLNVTDADLVACVRYCEDLEFVDVSWCYLLTRNILARLSRSNSRPLVLRLRASKFSRKKKSYEGLVIRLDLPPELYNPLQVRYDSGPPDYFLLCDSDSDTTTEHDHDSVRSCSPNLPDRADSGEGAEDIAPADAERRAEDFITENVNLIDLPDVNREDYVRLVVDVLAEDNIRAEDDLRAENVVNAEDAIRVDDAVRADDAVLVEDGVLVEEPVLAEDADHPEDAIHEEDATHEDVIREEDDMHVEAARGEEEDAALPEDAMREEAAMHVDVIREPALRDRDDLLLPIERRVEDAMNENDMNDEDDALGEVAGAMRLDEDDVPDPPDSPLFILRDAVIARAEDVLRDGPLIRDVDPEPAVEGEDEVLTNGYAEQNGNIGNRPQDDELPVRNAYFRVRVAELLNAAAADDVFPRDQFDDDEDDHGVYVIYPEQNADPNHGQRMLDLMYAEFGVDNENGVNNGIVNGVGNGNGLDNVIVNGVGNGNGVAADNDEFVHDVVFLQEDMLLDSDDDEDVVDN